MVAELNQLLGDERWWSALARTAAEGQFDGRVLEIFYSGLQADRYDPREVRDRLLPLPEREEGWKHVLLLGTTGAGKTTLVRQLIGTDPEDERFPTTATGRTTIADTEIILGDGPYEAAVTFFQLDEVRECALDCLLRAVLAAHRGEKRVDVQRAVLQHPDQRFRFNYVLGDGDTPETATTPKADADDLFDESLFEETTEPRLGMSELGTLAVDDAPHVIARAVDRVIELASQHGQRLTQDLDPNGVEDPQVLEELLEQGLDEALRDDDAIHELVDELVDQMAARFELVTEGKLQRNRQGWIESWTYETEDRAVFIRQLRRFTSNSKQGFGRLLTPLVSGVRVGAPFSPTWHDGDYPGLVLFDTEGLGHTPDSSSSMPTRLSRLIDETDAVLLVDNAEQPMQAASAAVLRALARSGHATKLHLCFTHFDGVTGDNLPTDKDRARHVQQSCTGVLARIGEDLGPFGERPLRHRVKTATYYLADMQKRYTKDDTSMVVKQLRKLLHDLESSGNRPILADTRPVYDKANLVVAVRDAVEDFTKHWNAILGLASSSEASRAHWGRIKALSRRFAFKMDDEYLNLRPVAHLQAELQGGLVKVVQNPLKWSQGEPTEEEKQAVLEDFVNRLNRGLLDLCRRRVAVERLGDWQAAFAKSGRGSTSERARIIADSVYGQAAPVPRAIPNANATAFLREVIQVVVDAAGELEVELL
ncbi:hypothetical protein [Streptomyces sp. NPDC020983]|uniref:hypothetical protein n=1 Tax=Streptomyces sp. NPDC020983 TaxID=3365106 RepID=UPI0037AF1CB9